MLKRTFDGGGGGLSHELGLVAAGNDCLGGCAAFNPRHRGLPRDKDQGWGRGLHGMNLLMAVAALAFFVNTLKVETDAVFLALWPVIFVLFAHGSKGDSRLGAMKKSVAEQCA